MSYNTKNYTEQGGETTHIGGDVFIDNGGTFHVSPGSTLKIDSAQTSGVLGINEEGVMAPAQAANQAASEATTIAALKEDFNALLEKLKAVRFMAADAPSDDDEPVAQA